MERLVVDVPVIGLLAAITEDPCCVEIVSCWGTLVEREVPRGYKFPHLERMSS